MWRITAVLACACAALTLAGGASSTTFGVADDAGKYAEDGGASFFHMLTDLGMTENRMAVFWDPAKQDTIFEQAFFDRALPNAMRRGIEVVFAIYPEKARSLVETPNGIELFAQYAAKVVQRYPYVRKVICLNEGNQQRYHQPQFDQSGKGISGYVQDSTIPTCRLRRCAATTTSKRPATCRIHRSDFWKRSVRRIAPAAARSRLRMRSPSTAIPT